MAGSPFAAMLLPQLMRQLGGGGMPGQGGGAPQPPGPQPNADAIGAAVGSEFSQLQGADPGKLTADLNEIKQKLAAMFPIAVLRIGDMGKGISQAIVGINAALKAAEKAQETLQNVKPLGLSAAQQNSPAPGSQLPPGMGRGPGGM